MKSHPIIHCPTSEGVSEVSERLDERLAQYLRVSGPALTSRFLVALDQSAWDFNEAIFRKNQAWAIDEDKRARG